MSAGVLASLAGAAALMAISAAPAEACPNGYKRVWIQGNPVCRLDATSTNSFKAATKSPTNAGGAALKK
jgi:hypothetical protein